MLLGRWQYRYIPDQSPDKNAAFTLSQLTPCVTMENIASTLNNFYSDYNQSGSGSTCQDSSHTVTSLADIFLSIASSFTQPRLVPNNANIAAEQGNPRRPGRFDLPGRIVLLHLFGNNQQHFHSRGLAVLAGWPELPILKRSDHELGLRKLRREDNVQSLKAAGLIHKAVDHDGIAVDRAECEVGTHDVIRPWRFKTRDVTRRFCFVRARQRVLQDPASGQSDMQKNGVGQPAAPHGGQFRILISSDSPTTTAPNCPSLGKRDLRGGWLAALVCAGIIRLGRGDAVPSTFATTALCPGDPRHRLRFFPLQRCRLCRSFPALMGSAPGLAPALLAHRRLPIRSQEGARLCLAPSSYRKAT